MYETKEHSNIGPYILISLALVFLLFGIAAEIGESIALGYNVLNSITNSVFWYLFDIYVFIGIRRTIKSCEPLRFSYIFLIILICLNIIPSIIDFNLTSLLISLPEIIELVLFIVLQVDRSKGIEHPKLILTAICIGFAVNALNSVLLIGQMIVYIIVGAPFAVYLEALAPLLYGLAVAFFYLSIMIYLIFELHPYYKKKIKQHNVSPDEYKYNDINRNNDDEPKQ